MPLHLANTSMLAHAVSVKFWVLTGYELNTLGLVERFHRLIAKLFELSVTRLVRLAWHN